MSDFYTRGEAREALVVQSMVEQGEYVLPRGYNNSVPSKPLLFHWLAALTSQLTGEVNEFALRFPSALLAVCAVSFFIFSLRTELKDNSQLLFITLLLCSFEWVRSSVSARVDMVHAATLSSGLLCAYFALERGKIRHWVLMIIFISMATLAKGPVAIALTAMILTAWLIINRGFSNAMKPLLQSGLALIIALFIALCWYGAAYLSSPQEFSAKFWYENVSRFTGTMSDAPHQHSAMYLIAMLIIGTAPASILIFLILFKERSRYLGKRDFGWRALTSLERFSIVAVITIIVFYCIPSGKRGVYLLTAYPFLALLATFLLQGVSYIGTQWLQRSFVIVLLVIVTTQTLIVPQFVAPRSSERALSKIILQNSKSSNAIYSYGFEFYGASFYSKKRFFRLEDAMGGEVNLIAQAPSPIIVLFADRLAELSKRLSRDKLKVRIIDQARLKGKEVLLATVE